MMEYIVAIYEKFSLKRRKAKKTLVIINISAK